MPRKNNKTSHVLNLITSGAAVDEAEETKTAAAEVKAESKPEAPVQEAPVPEAQRMVGQGAIDQLLAEQSEPSQASAAPNVTQTVQQVPVTEKRVTVVNKGGDHDKLSSQIMDKLADELRGEVKPEKDAYNMVNVMEQILKRQNLKRYMEQYGVCCCSRCCADVEALILTRLPAKYVVVDYSIVAPIMGYYESKYKVRILTEIIKSCIDVKDNPRHDRNGQIQYLKK